MLERASDRGEGAAKRIGIRGGVGNSEGDASERADLGADEGGVGVILFSQPDSSVYSALPSLRPFLPPPPPPYDVCWLSVCMSAFPFHFTLGKEEGIWGYLSKYSSKYIFRHLSNICPKK